MGVQGQGRHLSALPLLDAYVNPLSTVTATFETFVCWFA
jgi:hypothetical protein